MISAFIALASNRTQLETRSALLCQFRAKKALSGIRLYRSVVVESSLAHLFILDIYSPAREQTRQKYWRARVIRYVRKPLRWAVTRLTTAGSSFVHSFARSALFTGVHFRSSRLIERPDRDQCERQSRAAFSALSGNGQISKLAKTRPNQDARNHRPF